MGQRRARADTGAGGESAITINRRSKIVMPGQKRVFALDVPGINVFAAINDKEDVDGRA